MLHGSISILHILLIIVLTLQIKTLELPQQDEKKRHSKNSYQLPNKKSSDHLKDFHYSSSNLMNCGILKKIEYFPCSFNTHACTININLNSACVRCEICLSIVDQINQTLTFLHKKMLHINYLNDVQIESLFKIICNYSFANYGIRDIHGKRVIVDRTSEANLIVTNVDAQWEKHLQKRCYDLTEEMGVIKLYKYWKFWWDNKNSNEEIMELESVLCRDESTYFRDCKSIAYRSRQVTNNIGNSILKKKLNDIFQCI